MPQALATGNFDLRTHCRAVRVLIDAAGRTHAEFRVFRLGERDSVYSV